MKIKKISLLIVLIIASNVFSGCDLLWQRYVNKELGFSLSVPRLWNKEIGTYGTVLLVTSPKKGAADKYQENVTVVVSDLPEKMALDMFVDFSKEETLKVLPGEKFGISEGEIYANGKQGKWFSFNSKMGEDLVVRITSAAWMKGNRVYIVTCSGEYSNYDKYESTFNRILRSIRID